MKILVEHLWNGTPAHEHERVAIDLEVERGALRLAIDAGFHGDPPPAAVAGSTPQLWNHEVVELFLFGDDGRYLEVELGPHGHHLVLELEAVRTVTRRITEIDYPAPRIDASRWRGRAAIPLVVVPSATHVNAHAMHGSGDQRRLLSAGPHGGARPDFHRKDAALALDSALVAALRR